MLKKTEYLRCVRLCIIVMLVWMLCGCRRMGVSNISMEETPLLSAESFLETREETQDVIETQTPKRIYVHVCGCVKKPGVYVLEEGARLVDAVEAAGGTTSEADTALVNLAVILKDEMRIYIPSVNDTQEEQLPVITDASGVAYSLDGQLLTQTDLVNINTATIEQLTMLSGIGASRAADIIEYRNTYGNFDSIEDLKKVSGIKEGVFEKIKDQITVN